MIPADEDPGVARALYLFRERTVGRFATINLTQGSAWRDLVLQLTVTDLGVRSAAIALAASSENLAHMSPSSSDSLTENHKFYLRYYNRAIKVIRENIATIESAKDDRIVPCLVTNSLFTAIELSCNTLDRGFVHVRSGVWIARSYFTNVARSRQKLRFFYIEILRSLFERLNTFLPMFPGHGTSRYEIVLPDSNSPLGDTDGDNIEGPPYFASFQRAKNALYNLLRSEHVLNHHANRTIWNTSPNLNNCNISYLEYQHHISLLLFRTNSFLGALSHYLAIARSALTELDLYLSVLLTLHARLLVLRLTICQNSPTIRFPETTYDAYTASFSEALNSIKGLERMLTTNVGVDFIAHLPDVHPIFWIGCKSRDPHVRRLALGMLKSRTHKQNVWCGATQAKVLERIIEVEEDGIDGGVTASGDVDESRRIQDLAMEIDYQNKRAGFRYWVLNEYGYVVMKEEILC